MAKRKGLSKRTRFEVLKRDAFTCQYCGAKAPDTVLHVDHIDPVANGGSDALINLVTSCVPCNGGKGAVPLDDQSAVEKQRLQLEELQERREQIDMMVEWQKGLSDVDDYATEQIAEYWSQLTPGWHLNELGKKNVRKLIKKHNVANVMSAMREAADEHVVLVGEPPVATEESQRAALDAVPGICRLRSLYAEKPHMRRLFYIRGILRRRFDDCDEQEIIHMLERGFDLGLSIDGMEEVSKSCSSYRRYRNALAYAISEREETN